MTIGSIDPATLSQVFDAIGGGGPAVDSVLGRLADIARGMGHEIGVSVDLGEAMEALMDSAEDDRADLLRAAASDPRFAGLFEAEMSRVPSRPAVRVEGERGGEVRYADPLESARAQAGAGDYSFLDDPNMPLEMKLLMFFAAKADDLEEEVLDLARATDRADAAEAQAQAGGGGGMVQAFVELASEVVPGADAVAARFAPGGREAAGAAPAGESTMGENEREQRIQYLVNRRNQLTTLVSNLQQTLHDNHMAFINNIRV